ncbi:cell division cycle protein 27 homolog isoform X2 [Bacillus rossius redtenbacheri]|uniref:cell division cycle protein 27 homolog isoform X2 n=1 Tax=Bacillus rossius redtenbacheri TaxID=93214 RepID=UPI002FDE7B11
MIVQEPVQATIWHCLNHYAYPDAIFLAERLYAEVESEESMFLLATCYYRSGKTWQAYAILHDKKLSSPQCRYLLAKCCLDLQKISEAETIITGGDFIRMRTVEEIVSDFGEQACFVLLIYARICAQTERSKRASEAYRKALKLNPFLWSAFEELCNRGEKPDPVRTFEVSNLDNFSMCYGVNPVLSFVNSCGYLSGCPNMSNTSSPANNTDPINSTPIQVLNCFNSTLGNARSFVLDESPLAVALNSTHSALPTFTSARGKNGKFRNLFSGVNTPSFGFLPLDNTGSDDSLQKALAVLSPSVPPSTLMEANDQKSLAKRVSSLRAHVGLISRKETPLQLSKPVFSQSGNTGNSNIPSSPSQPVATPPLQPSQNVRRSSRLFSNSYSVKENNKSPNRNKFVTPKSPSRKTKSRMSKTNLNKTSFSDLNERNRSEKEKSETITSSESRLITNTSMQNVAQKALLLQKQSAEGLMQLLREMGTAYLHLSQFNCHKAIECLDNLPPQQRNTGWVLCMLGKAHYELAQFKESASCFREVRERERYRCQLMELYSTALWQLQHEVALSALAQELVDQDRSCAAAWCAAGNCFSLQKEHDSAIKFFQRAVQVDPLFVYAYTLLGHEFVTTEELDKAMSCFRSAIRIDSRHYNAIYGIGTIYSKQERYKLAEVYFRKALAINSQSSVLLCHVGVVQHALQKTDAALQTLNLAISKDPANPLCKFHRASIYFAVGRHVDALKELEELKEMVPRESLVYYLTGRVHKKLGNTHLALMHFSWATDLDPKGANSQIKEGIDPALTRSQVEDDSSTPAGEDFPSEGSLAVATPTLQRFVPASYRTPESDDSI